VIIVDEMRAPSWFPSQAALDTLLPNLARIRSRATSFENHYTAANMCVAARGTMLTGLYGHQTGCMLTKAVAESSTLSSKFPTWGTMLRQQGYETTWWGKWHLGPEPDKTPGGLEAYGFDGGTYPSPNGNPEQGKEKDPLIAEQFIEWIDGADTGPWCTTVSLVNPHDINWWPRFTTLDEVCQPVDYRFTGSPPNVETAAQLLANKPRLQTALEQTIAMASGPVPNEGGPLEEASWAENRTMYLLYQQEVDAQIGRVLDALQALRILELALQGSLRTHRLAGRHRADRGRTNSGRPTVDRPHHRRDDGRGAVLQLQLRRRSPPPRHRSQNPLGEVRRLLPLEEGHERSGDLRSGLRALRTPRAPASSSSPTWPATGRGCKRKCRNCSRTW
jgi:Sulfatase